MPYCVAEEPGLRGEAEYHRMEHTAMVSSSASLNVGAIPTSGRLIRRVGLAASSSSIFTYSALAEVSMQVSTRPPRLPWR
jgi:hypothetical protein